MAYIGNQTTTSFSSMAKQSITGNGGTGYTLTHAVANAQEIEVFVNNVRQEPGVAYTVSGTTLTMTGNVASSDDFYVVYQGLAVQTSVPGDNTVTTAMLQDNAATAAKVDSTLHLSTIKDSSGTNNAMTIASNGVVSSTAVITKLRHSSSVTIPDNSTTNIPFQVADQDTHSLYDATNDRLKITSEFNGSTFLISWGVGINAGGAGDNMQAHLSYNGNIVQTDQKFYNGAEGESIGFNGTWFGQVNTDDYFKVTAFCDRASGSSSSNTNAAVTYLMACKIF
tara:strand:+ start:286 stop:1128 length:843 start_codon:yes stop_codon:yes gene_type:complete